MTNFSTRRFLAIFGTVATFVVATPLFADGAIKEAAQDIKTKVYELADKDMSKVTFSKNSASLSASEKSELKALVNGARANNKISKVIVAAWSAREYPATKDQELPKAERKLAEKRAQNVKQALRDLGVQDVDVHTMTERPSWLAKTFNTDDTKLKGEGKTNASDDQVVEEIGKKLRDKGGPDSAVVLIRHE